MAKKKPTQDFDAGAITLLKRIDAVTKAFVRQPDGPVDLEATVHEQIAHLIEGAKRGDQKLAHRLVEVLSLEIRCGRTLSAEATTYLGDALDAIAKDGDPKAAFNLSGRRGKRDRREAQRRNVWWAIDVESARRPPRKLTLDDAIAFVAEEEEKRTGKKQEHAIRKAWQKHRRHLEVREDGWVFFFGAPVDDL